MGTNLRWNPEDEELLRKIYPKFVEKLITKEEMQRIFGRTMSAIISKACSLGISSKYDKSRVDKKYLKELLRRRQIEI